MSMFSTLGMRTGDTQGKIRRRAPIIVPRGGPVITSFAREGETCAMFGSQQQRKSLLMKDKRSREVGELQL